MPNNSLGDDQSDIPTPRDQGFSGNNDFGIMRYLDGRRRPEDQITPDADTVRNIHEPTGDSGYGLVEVAVFLLILAIAVAIFVWALGKP